MGGFPVAARVYIWATILFGLALAAWLSRELQLPETLAATVVLLSLFLTSVLCDFFPIHLSYKVAFTLATASNFAILLIFGLPYGIAVGTVSSLASDVLMRKSWYKSLFNAANTAISIAFSGAVYWTIQGGSLSPLSSVDNALATVVAGSTYLTLNWALVCLVIGLTSSVSPIDAAIANLKGVSFQVITLIPLGTLVVVLYQANPWALILIVFPIILVHYSFDNYQKLRSQSMRTIELLAAAIDKRDAYTYQHSQRVAEFSEKIAKRMGLGIEEREAILFAARIHDLGKVGLDTYILLKPTGLTKEERRKVEEHPVIGAEILGQLSLYSGVREMVIHHQERYDGTGYPAKLKGAEIPLGARIIAVADSFEAMISDRPYRRGMTIDEAVAELKRSRGMQFDPAPVDALLEILAEELAEKNDRVLVAAADTGVG